MAGSIFVSKTARVSLTTQQFDYMTERIRAAWPADADVFLQSVFEPVDEGGMSFISAEEVPAGGLHALFDASRHAMANARAELGSKAFEPLWIDLLAKMRQDPRFSQDWDDRQSPSSFSAAAG